jgi:hypothetical protein
MKSLISRRYNIVDLGAVLAFGLIDSFLIATVVLVGGIAGSIYLERQNGVTESKIPS